MLHWMHPARFISWFLGWHTKGWCTYVTLVSILQISFWNTHKCRSNQHANPLMIMIICVKVWYLKNSRGYCDKAENEIVEIGNEQCHGRQNDNLELHLPHDVEIMVGRVSLKLYGWIVLWVKLKKYVRYTGYSMVFLQDRCYRINRKCCDGWGKESK